MTKSWAIDGLNCAGVNREQMEKTLKGGVHAINLTALRPYGGLVDSLVFLEQTRAVIEAMDDVAFVARTAADIEKAAETNRVGIILGTQDSTMVEADVKLLATFKELGIRILQPNYNKPNRFGCGAPQEGPEDTGMTEAGREWLEEMHRLRLIIDLSHCGHRTTSAFIAASKGRPLVISHANAFAVCPSLRNKTDDHIRGVAETGGLTGAVMWSPAVRHDERPTMDDYLNHIDRLVKVGGIDHVAFASDVVESPRPDPEKWDKSYGPNGADQKITGVLGDWYVFETRLNADFQSLTDTPAIWEAMRKRGYGEDAVEKVMRGNWLRVMKDIWGE
ncbi:dipeptidase [Nitratireductor soli]|uniref:dipeptidase n=1 Tax=Nitratireductor soli TaxID=1670619 RepID=UPI00065E5F8E|nr:membrane dipeptidase [Nitratireductor soli]